MIMKSLNSIELLEISGGTTDLGRWLIDKVGDFFCGCSKINWSGIPAHESALHGPNARATY